MDNEKLDLYKTAGSSPPPLVLKKPPSTRFGHDTPTLQVICVKCRYPFEIPHESQQDLCARCRGGNSLTRHLVDYHIDGDIDSIKQATKIILDFIQRKSRGFRMPGKNGVLSHAATYDFVVEWIHQQFAGEEIKGQIVEWAVVPREELLAQCRGNPRPPFCFWALACWRDAQNEVTKFFRQRRLEQERCTKIASGVSVPFDPQEWLAQHWPALKRDLGDRVFAVLEVIVRNSDAIDSEESFKGALTRAIQYVLQLSESQAQRVKNNLVELAKKQKDQPGPMRDLFLELVEEKYLQTSKRGGRGQDRYNLQNREE